MARTHRWNKKSEARFFSKAGGYTDLNPHKVSRNGSGRHNWGRPGDELEDEPENAGHNYFYRADRRNSNHAVNEDALKRLNDQCNEIIDP